MRLGAQELHRNCGHHQTDHGREHCKIADRLGERVEVLAHRRGGEDVSDARVLSRCTEFFTM